MHSSFSQQTFAGALEPAGAPVVLDAQGLSPLIGRARVTIQADLSRRPWALPPSIKIGKKTLWLYSSVIAWLKAQERPTPPAPAPEPQPPRRRGRPRKAAQLAREQKNG